MNCTLCPELYAFMIEIDDKNILHVILDVKQGWFNRRYHWISVIMKIVIFVHGIYCWFSLYLSSGFVLALKAFYVAAYTKVW